MSEVGCDGWAVAEFGSCVLGDLRRTKRLVKIASGLSAAVGCAVSSCCGRAAAQLISRFFNQDEVTVESVLKSHIRQTAERCADMGLVIGVQDTTFLDFTGRKDLQEDLGPIGPAAASRGVLMHSVLAISPGRSVLGLLGMSIWARDPAEYGMGARRRSRLVGSKESGKWLDGLAQAEYALPECQPLLIVGDRESDVFALFAAPRRARTDLLVRANQNRAIVDEEFRLMREAIERAPVLGIYEVTIPRQGSRRTRVAKLEVRARQITVRPPRHKTRDVSDESLALYCVRARELDAGDGVEPLEWTLLTSMAVTDLSSACKMLEFYSVRWVIEEFHRVLKSGCRVERVQFETLDRLKPVIAVLSVIAWRVLALSKKVREEPDADASCICTETERVVMERWMLMKNEKRANIQTAEQFVWAVAVLGGFQGRKGDGHPGTKTLWQGLRRLQDLVVGYELAMSLSL